MLSRSELQPAPTVYKENKLSLLQSANVFQRAGYSYPASALVDGILETNQDKPSVTSGGIGGYCYVSGQNIATPVLKLGLQGAVKVDNVSLLMRDAPPDAGGLQWNLINGQLKATL